MTNKGKIPYELHRNHYGRHRAEANHRKSEIVSPNADKQSGHTEEDIGKLDQHGGALFEKDLRNSGQRGRHGDHEQPWQHDFEIDARLRPLRAKQEGEKPFGNEEKEDKKRQ